MSHEVRWTAEKIVARLRLITPLVHHRSVALPPFRYKELEGPSVPAPVGADVDDADWELLPEGSFWGRPQMDFAMRGQFCAPAEWDRAVPTELLLPIGKAPDFSHPEALIYVDGAPYAAVDRYHQEIRLRSAWLDRAEHLLALRGFTGIWKSDQRGGATPFQLYMGHPRLVQVHEPTRAFVTTARVALEAAQALDADHPARWQLLNALDDAFRALDTREPLGQAFYDSVPHAHRRLREGIDRAGAPHAAAIAACGHGHLDLAWLWTLAQGRRKAERTMHNAVRLMEEFPRYHFTQSQPQLYDYIRQDHADLFQEIQALAQEGRWEPLGGMWVEADCNLSGPESLARQFVLGQRFLRRHFGEAVSPVLWLPDVFGYAWNLPQLIKQAGLEYFFTIKIGWSQYNRLPYDSFWWQGLDGTKVLTHFSTTPEASDFPSHGTYNAVLSPRWALETWRNFRHKEAQQELLMSFGYGDGGGGPNREMLQNMEELAQFPAVPRVQPSRAVDFFRRLEAQSGERLPTWNGELYLELHRGTYTSQSRNKRANRKSEFLLHDVEFLATLAAQLDPDYGYPRQALDEAWRVVCLNQFHDIIPGSSIREVYVESLQQYEQVRQHGESLRQEALQRIARQVGSACIVANPSSFARHDLVFWRGSLPRGTALQRSDGVTVHSQGVANGVLLDVGQLPPYSVTPLEAVTEPAPPPNTSLVAQPHLLENDFVRVELDDSGDVTRIYDKVRCREVIPDGARANQFQAFEDRPLNWDAWDVDIFFDDRVWLAEAAESVRVVEKGPLRATLELRRRILDSPFLQRVSLCHNSPQITFETRIDWQQRHTLLKVAFPVRVLSPQASFEIQWGHVQRPTHRNTSWDWARFETCAQKWVDLSEGDYGVSLLNDGKYGHDVRDDVMRLTLLRSPTHPDPQADQGEHYFVYALLPHDGALDERTLRAAYALNDPLLMAHDGEVDATRNPGQPISLVAVDRPNVVVETVKQAEDGADVVVRLYEAMRQRGPVTLTCCFPLQAAFITNLLEENEQELQVEGNRVTFPIRPFQIVTLRLRR